MNTISKGKNPKVSVILPTYQRKEELKRAINSVVSQTYNDFELIIVDDASAEKPNGIIETFRDHRIKLLIHSTNKGGSAARNTGIQNSSGDFIAFLDSDDEWLPEKLEIQVDCLEKLSEKVGVHYSGIMIVSATGSVLGQRIPSEGGNLERKLYGYNPIGPLSSVVVRRSALEISGLFDEELPSCQDWELYIRLGKKFEYRFTPKVLVKYYLSKNSITKNFEAKAAGHQMVLEKYEKEVKKNSANYGRQMLTIGHFLCCSGNTSEGRKRYFQAFKTNPTYLRSLLYLFLSFFGSSGYKFLVKIKKNSLNKL